MEYRNAQYNADGTIDCQVKHPIYSWIPFTASPHDCEQHGRQMFDLIRKQGKAKAYQPPDLPSDAELAAHIRHDRDDMLKASDWSQLPDVPEGIRQKWQAYRQALRDITEQPGFPRDISWPEKPL